MSASFRQESRGDWNAGICERPTTEQLVLGCLQRIADATELMAKRYQDLISEREQAQRSRDYYQQRCYLVERSRNALRGQITKMKKARSA